MAVTWVHLTRLGAYLIIFGPKLLGSHGMEVPGAVAIVSRVKVNTSGLVIVDMKGVDREDGVLDEALV